MKFIPRTKKSSFTERIWHHVHKRFTTLSALQSKLQESFPEHVGEVLDCEIDFFEKRNNKKCWIKNVDDMYANHCPSDSLKLWCIEQDKPIDEGVRPRKPTQDKRLGKESRKDLESPVQELSDKQGKNYTEAQLRVWVRLIINGLHKDMDNPPNIPIISGEEEKKS